QHAAESIFAAVSNLDFFAAQFKFALGIADSERGAVFQEDGADSHPVDQRTVLAVLVAQPIAAIDFGHRMGSGHGRVAHAESVIRRAADLELTPGADLGQPDVRPRNHSDRVFQRTDLYIAIIKEDRSRNLTHSSPNSIVPETSNQVLWTFLKELKVRAFPSKE